MMFSVRSRLAGITVPLLLLVLLATSSQLQAQVFFAGPGGNNDEAMKKQYIESLKQKKAAAENRIRSRIADIDRACELSEIQKKKLSVASKGAVNAFVEKAKKSLEQQAKSMGVEIDFDDLEAEEPEAEEEEEAPANGNAAIAIQAFAMGGMLGGGQSNNVENSKIWQSSVKKVLDKEQTKKWDQWLEQRNAYQRRVAVEQFVAKVDRKLLLSPEQREELTVYVDEKHGKKLLKRATSRDRNNMGMNVIVNGGFRQANDENDADADEKLQEILSESQLQEWQESIEGQLSGMGMGMGIGGPNINVIGNAIEIVEELQIDDMIEEDEDDDN